MKKNQAGVSLVETMVAMALAIGIGVILMRQNEFQQKMMSGFETAQEAFDFVNQTRMVLANGDSCFETLKTLTDAGGPVTDIKDKTGAVFVAKNVPLQRNFLKLTELDFKVTNPTLGIGVLEMRLEKMKKVIGPDNVLKSITLKFRADPVTRLITRCGVFPDVDMGTICNSMDASYDPVTEKCNIKEIFFNPKTALDTPNSIIDRSYFAKASINPNFGTSPNNSWGTDLANSPNLRICSGAQVIQRFTIPAVSYPRSVRVDVRFAWQTDDGGAGDKFNALLRAGTMVVQRISGTVEGGPSGFRNWSVRSESMEGIFEVPANQSTVVELELMHPTSGDCFRASNIVHMLFTEL